MTSHSLNLAFLVFFVLPNSLLAESVDLSKIYQCDPLFCPDNQGVPTPVGEGVTDRTGIGVGSANEGLKQVDRVVVSLEDVAPKAPSAPKYPQPQTSPTEYSGGGGYSDNSEQGSSEEASIDNPEEGLSGAGISGQAKIGSSLQPRQVPISKFGNGTVKAGGLLYSDSNSIESKELDRSFDTGSSASDYQRQAFESNNAVQANLSQDTSNKKGRSKTPQSLLNSASTGSSLQSNRNPSSGDSPEKKGVIRGGLEGLVSALGKFGSAIGLGSGGSPSAPLSNSGVNPKRTQKTGRRQVSSVEKDLLQKNLNAHLRGLASDLKLGTADSNLFQSMCQHYDHYTLKNRIPSDTQGCEDF